MPSISGEGPDAREGHSATLVDKRLFIFGGCGKSYDEPEEVYFNDLYILDTGNPHYTKTYLELHHSISRKSCMKLTCLFFEIAYSFITSM